MIVTAGPLLAKDNDSAKRFLGMGFTITRVMVHQGDDDWLGPDIAVIDVDFQCICGTPEHLHSRTSPEALKKGLVNVYELIRRAGAIERKHLLGDGYTEQQIDDMEHRAGVPLSRPLTEEEWMREACRTDYRNPTL